MKGEPWRGSPTLRVQHLEQKLSNKKKRIAELEARNAELEGVTTLDGHKIVVKPRRTLVYQILRDNDGVPHIVPTTTNIRKIIEQSYFTRPAAEAARGKEQT